MQLIDVEAFIEHWNKEFRMRFPNDMYLVALSNFPAIDPASLRPKGEWKPRTDVVGFVNCSVCQECNIYDDWADGKKWNFCPSCGADMRKEAHNGC